MNIPWTILSGAQIAFGIAAISYFYATERGRAQNSDLRRAALIVSMLGILSGGLGILFAPMELITQRAIRATARVTNLAFWVAFVWFFILARRQRRAGLKYGQSQHT